MSLTTSKAQAALLSFLLYNVSRLSSHGRLKVLIEEPFQWTYPTLTFHIMLLYDSCLVSSKWSLLEVLWSHLSQIMSHLSVPLHMSCQDRIVQIQCPSLPYTCHCFLAIDWLYGLLKCLPNGNFFLESFGWGKIRIPVPVCIAIRGFIRGISPRFLSYRKPVKENLQRGKIDKYKAWDHQTKGLIVQGLLIIIFILVYKIIRSAKVFGTHSSPLLKNRRWLNS